MRIFVDKNCRVVAAYNDNTTLPENAHAGLEEAWVPDGTSMEVGKDGDVLFNIDPRPSLGPEYAIALAKRELAEIDAVLPRAVEDMNSAMKAAGVNLTLPPIMVQRMARKEELRAIIRGV